MFTTSPVQTANFPRKTHSTTALLKLNILLRVAGRKHEFLKQMGKCVPKTHGTLTDAQLKQTAEKHLGIHFGTEKWNLHNSIKRKSSSTQWPFLSVHDSLTYPYDMRHPDRAVNPEERHYDRAPVFHILPPVLHDWNALGSIQRALQKLLIKS